MIIVNRSYLSFVIATTLKTGFLVNYLTKGKINGGGGLIGSIAAYLTQALFLFLPFAFMWNLLSSILSYYLGIKTVDLAAKRIFQKYGPRKRHDGTETKYDFNEINIDEVHGQFIAGISAFMYGGTEIWEKAFTLTISLILFRIFDTLKPFPIKKIEKMWPNSAFGIMIDDTITGLFAALIAPLWRLL